MGISKFNLRRVQVIKMGDFHLNRSETHNDLVEIAQIIYRASPSS